MTIVRRSAAAVLAMVVAGLVMVVSATPVWAHIDLAESDPQNVSTVDEPVEQVRLTFTGEADPAIDQFLVEDPDGNAVPITSVEPEGDGTTLVVTPVHALAGGRHRVTWVIRSDDSHTMNDTVAFTVNAPAVAAPTDRAAGGTSPSTIATAPIAETAGSSPTAGAERIATLARWLVYAALLFCVGGLGYLTWVHRGSAAEGRRLAFLIRRAALVVAVGAIVELLAHVVVVDGGSVGAVFSPGVWGDVVGANFGVGTFLRLAGAALVLAFLRIDLDHTFVLDGAIGFDELSARDLALLDEPGGGVATRVEPTTAPLVRLRVEASPIAFVGAVLLVASEAFLGHTATTQPRLLVVASDVGHLVAAGLWGAGAVMLAATINRRHRRGLPLDALTPRHPVLGRRELVSRRGRVHRNGPGVGHPRRARCHLDHDLRQGAPGQGRGGSRHRRARRLQPQGARAVTRRGWRAGRSPVPSHGHRRGRVVRGRAGAHRGARRLERDLSPDAALRGRPANLRHTVVALGGHPVRTRLVLPAAVVAAGLVLGVCSSSDHGGMEAMNDGNTPMDNGSMGDMGSMGTGGQGSTTTLVIPDGAEFNATDVYFAQGMIPHHGQAVQMADMALAVSTNPDVTALAEQIKAAQSPEIEQMTAWLTDWDQAVPDPNAMMDDNMDGAGGMMMSGMMSAADMARLGNAAGSDFDRMFLEMMILHHEGAIEMAEQQLAEGMYQPTKDLAQAVITGQQAEIDEMNALIADLPA